MSTILVTGASGVLGSAVARHLRDRGESVRTFQRRASGVDGVEDVRGSLTDTNDVARAVAGVDAVIHLAAKVSFAGPLHEFEAVNIDGTQAILDAARSQGVPDVVMVSSPSVAHHGSSIVGAEAGPADPQRARGNYARTKAAAELLALDADGTDLRVCAIRPHVVWGPGDTQLVERVIARAKSGRLPLLDQGAALIDTTYLDNAVEAIVAGLDRMEQARGQALVVTNGQPRTVGELVGGICRAGGAPVPRRRVPGSVARVAGGLIEAVWAVAPGEDEPPMTRFLAEQLSTAHWFDQRRTREVLDWTPRVSIAEGMSRLAAHYGGSV